MDNYFCSQIQEPNVNNHYFIRDYHDRTIYDSNCIEFWAPMDSRVCPGIIPNRYWISTFGNTFDTFTQRPCGISVHQKVIFNFNLILYME